MVEGLSVLRMFTLRAVSLIPALPVLVGEFHSPGILRFSSVKLLTGLLPFRYYITNLQKYKQNL